jgi:hypothetical protein
VRKKAVFKDSLVRARTSVVASLVGVVAVVGLPQLADRIGAQTSSACLGQTQFEIAVCAAAPISTWRFQEPAGTSVFADSVGGASAVIQPTPSDPTGGVVGGAVGPRSLEGQTSLALNPSACGGGLELSSPERYRKDTYTWAYWFRRDSVMADPYSYQPLSVVGSVNDGTTGTAGLYRPANESYGSSPNGWRYVVAVFSPSVHSLYVNGTLQGERAAVQ